ncbi:MAG: DUF255 domain-containing protein [Bacteroidetes bacterium]|nr:DUF255 domain-containing protein [Bacteroidota bacterium]
MYKYLLISILALSVAACNGTKKTPQDPFPTDDKGPKSAVDFIDAEMLMPVLAQAKEEGKLIFLDVYTTWCLPCKLMDEEVFPNKEIGNFMNKHFINMKVDAEKGNGVNLAAIYEVKVFPTLLFLSPDGRVLQRKEGAAFHKELMQLGENALKLEE